MEILKLNALKFGTDDKFIVIFTLLKYFYNIVRYSFQIYGSFAQKRRRGMFQKTYTDIENGYSFLENTCDSCLVHLLQLLSIILGAFRNYIYSSKRTTSFITHNHITTKPAICFHTFTTGPSGADLYASPRYDP